MAFEMRNLNLFGLDLAELVSNFKTGWIEALEWPVFARWVPRPVVRVWDYDGSQRVVCYLTGRTLPVETETTLTAAVLDPDLVLCQVLKMPDLNEQALTSALSLEVARLSPFGQDGTVWGWLARRVAEGLEVELVMVMRDRVDAALRPLIQAGVASPEAWVVMPGGRPIVLRGFGEFLRLRKFRSEILRTLAALIVAAGLAGAVVASPFLQLRARVFDAQAQFAELQRASHEAVKAREALLRAKEQAAALDRVFHARPDVLALLEELSRLLPDDAYLIRLDVEGHLIRLSGQGSNASALVDKLGGVQVFSGLRSPSPIVRVGNTGAERFSLEFNFTGNPAGERP